MGLDDKLACPNFRDVGEWVNILGDIHLLPIGRLLRGGRLDAVRSLDEIGAPGTLVNLRVTADPLHLAFSAESVHVPAVNDRGCYGTADPLVRDWLAAVLRSLAHPALRLPVLLHCKSGKDRTGVAVAAVLSVLGIDPEIIVEEYLLSEGLVDRDWIRHALEGLGDVETSFPDVDLAALRVRFAGP